MLCYWNTQLLIRYELAENSYLKIQYFKGIYLLNISHFVGYYFSLDHFQISFMMLISRV